MTILLSQSVCGLGITIYDSGISDTVPSLQLTELTDVCFSELSHPSPRESRPAGMAREAGCWCGLTMIMMFPLDSGPTRHLNTTNNPVIPAAARACLDQEKARSSGSNTGSDQMYTGEVP